MTVREVFGKNSLQRAARQRKGRELAKTFFGPVGEPAYIHVVETLVVSNEVPVYHGQA